MTKHRINAGHGSALYGVPGQGVEIQPDCSVKGKGGFSKGGEVRTKFKGQD